MLSQLFQVKKRVFANNVVRLLLRYSYAIVFLLLLGVSFVTTESQYLVLLAISYLILRITGQNTLSSLWITFFASLFGLRVLEFPVFAFTYEDLNFGNFPGIYVSDLVLLAITFELYFQNKLNSVASIKMFKPWKLLTLLLFLITAGVSVLVSVYQTISFYYLIWLAKYILLFVVARVVFEDLELKMKTIDVVSLYILASSGMAIIQYLFGGVVGLDIEDSFQPFGNYYENFLFRPGGFSADPNVLSTMIVSWLPLLLIQLRTRKVIKPGYYVLMYFIILLALVAASSRWAWFVSVVTLVIGIKYFGLGVFFLKKYMDAYSNLKKTHRNLAAGGAMALFVIVLPSIFSRVLTVSQAFFSEGSAYYRFRQLAYGIGQALSSPLGVGLGMFPYSVPLSSGTNLHFDLPHSFIVQLVSETGFLGLALFCFFIYILFREKLNIVRRSKKSESAPYLLALFSTVALMSFYPWFFHPRVGWIFWVVAAL